ncbi:ABC transporter permease [Ornithinicoccus hortensis]|uniref:FtsX-like permease family protein n=1 Tax=Ornithinicoccus hortensis TaxID=82346 RepID=A0A542YN96_9MICO|nr:FtsX-like permease family protein [Ornithinicoccus hortensis]TQL49583.1 FtsX-like permease family protein [Ornithinicoccus hortensis]
MGVLRLLLRRARAGLGLLATLLLLTAGTTAVVAGTVGYARAGAIEAGREALSASSEPAESAVSATTRQGADPATQEAVARAAIAGAFSPAPVEVVASELSEPRQVAGRAERLVALSSPSLLPGDPSFRDRVGLVAGRWPEASADGPVEGALPPAFADGLGVGVGDVLTVGDAEVTVVATWQPVDPDDPIWLGDPPVAAAAPGGDGAPVDDAAASAGERDGTGLLIVPPGEGGAAGPVPSFGGDPYLRWTVLPDTERMLPEHLAVLAGGATDLRASMDDPDLVVRGLVVDGDLAPTAARAAEDLAAARALSVVPITVLLLVSIIAVVQITRVQAATRAAEAELLMARGAARRQVLWWTLLEAGGTGLAGTVLGVGLAVGALQTVPSGPSQTGTVLLVGTAAGAAVLVSLVAVNALQVRALDAGRTGDRSGRGREAVPVAALVFVVGAGLLALWQLHLYESPLITTGTGEVGVDLLASAAPALLLASAAALTAAGLGPFARSLERLTAPCTGAVAHLAATQVARRLVVYAAPLALVVLASGTTTIASLYASTAGGLRDDLATLGTGADLRAP